MRLTSFPLLLALVMWSALEAHDAVPRLICCGMERVFVIDLTGQPTKPAWSWQAADSPAIGTTARKWFATTDDCKPYGDEILITSSSGGVALIRRADSHCRFYAASRNAHSACLLPENRVAVAASTGGDEVQVFAIGANPLQEQPVARLPLKGAHGVEWDAERSRLWALGSDELLLLETALSATPPQLRVDRRWTLPTPGGHDLSPTADGRGYYVTTDTRVYRFDRQAGTFELQSELGELARVKSIDQQRESGEIVYHQATGEPWWSDTIRFAGARPPLTLPGERLYKVRWDQPRERP